jgi:hypothetical protein
VRLQTYRRWGQHWQKPTELCWLVHSAFRPVLSLMVDWCQTVLTSAIEHRKYNLSLYGVELPVHDPWTAQMRTINQVVDLFELTTAVARAHKTSGSTDAVTEGMIRMQVAELASVLFKCCYDRLEWLKRLATVKYMHCAIINDHA